MKVGVLKEWLSKPVDIAFLVYFRFFSGCFIAGEVLNQLFTGDYLSYVKPQFHFSYQFFPFLRYFPSEWAQVLFPLIIISGLAVAFGFYYRFFSVLLFISHTFLFLLEKSEFVNHFYLYCLVTFFLMILPAHHSHSLDAKRLKIVQNQVPAWMYYLLIFQISVVYFYGGVAKLHQDWFEARAMIEWVKYGPVFPVIGNFLINDYTPWFMSYFGIVFDLLIAPAMLWRKSRAVAFIFACLFHLTNVVFFGLATFPWFSIMMTALYFGPSFPSKWGLYQRISKSQNEQLIEPNTKISTTFLSTLLVYCCLQLLIPLRHYLYPGSSNWTEEGHRFSWHMMLRGKQAYTTFQVVTAESTFFEDGNRGITPHQNRKMSYDPDMILEYAHFLRDEYEKMGYTEVQVYAQSLVGLNGRKLQRFIKADVDLAAIERGIGHYTFIEELKN